MPEQLEVGSPPWWMRRLGSKLTNRAKHVKKLEDYYEGDHPLPLVFDTKNIATAAAAKEAEVAYRNLLKMGITNWVALVADAPAERLGVIGFRFSEQVDGLPTEDEMWARIWQANQLDADSGLVHGRALQTGQAFVLVWPGVDEKSPLITVEDPSQVIVAYEAGSRRKRAAALKRWVADDGHLHATLYLPSEVYKYRSKQKHDDRWGDGGDFDSEWERREVAGEEWPLKSPFGRVSMVEFRANPRLKPSVFGGGRSEFEQVLPIQDRINRTLYTRLMAQEFSSFRQRWVTGMEIPTDPLTNEPISPFKVAMDRLFMTEKSEAKFGEFSATDLVPFIKASESDVQSMAAITKTPPYYLLGEMVNISADAIKAADAGLVAKTGGHLVGFSESHEEVWSLGLQAIGDPRHADKATMVLWKDVEQRTWAQTVDALVKMKELDVPTEALWERLPGVTPTDIKRWKAMREAELLEAAVAEFGTGRADDQGLPPERDET